ncbi:MAG: MBOAT family O-acyltransferase [Chloroflexota bacterium]
MIYSSPEFLLFFILFFAVYWVVRGRMVRMMALVVGSLVFYAAGDPRGLPVLLGLAVVGYMGGLVIGPRPEAFIPPPAPTRRGTRARRRAAAQLPDFGASRAGRAIALGVAVVLLLAPLAWTKYGAFVGRTVTSLLAGAPAASLRDAALPLGVSFFTFELIAYVVDVFRGRCDVERSPLKFLAFLTFFPRLIAGPIIRPGQFFPQLADQRRWWTPEVVSGLQMFVEGFFKKSVLANPAGRIADQVFASPAQFDTASVWFGVTAYAVQIWADFSGYTDMGRGVARMLGYELPINFLRPYLASSPSDFWRRWHISLSTWLRDYLYIPLGGSRGGKTATAVNLLITMVLGGLWHGANWTFLVWGAYHGGLLVIQRIISWSWPRFSVPRPVGIAITLLAVMHGWVLFRAPTLDMARTVLGRMYGWPPAVTGTQSLPTASQQVVALVAAGALAGMLAAEFWPAAIVWYRRQGSLQGAVAAAAAATIVYVSYMFPASGRPFIYFRF